ncbi:MATE family efflux transporter [Methanogenium sp. S4BF]|uniref:MATE family efflux transporter n=1 Tax=Methanogenium sp. S4BF TaxID=1789226 RepID=UPI0024174259|nr:MATE family efflux transporter [Methanogenium sp. S4BF]WFN34028.1 MATE family efflux transporter [Methanogenium sp. S4BF]
MTQTAQTETLRTAPSAAAETTKGVSILTGDPKRAIIKLSGPMIIAMLLMSVYNIVDAIWVAGLGPDALAAIGFVTPVFMVLIGFSNGIGAGATSAIARRIGAKDREGADNTAMHALYLTVIVSVVMTACFLIFLRPVLLLIGAGDTIGLALEYAYIVFGGTIFILFTNVAYGILRAEGDMKRTMYAMAASSVVNLVLDPILIYGLDMGMAGAALATVISVTLVSAVLLWWFLGKRDTYVTIHRRSFHYQPAIAADILRVGLPASGEFLLMAGVGIILNGLLVTVAGTDGVAVYTGGWRVVMFAIVPMIGITTAVISVTGALYGAKRYAELRTVHRYSTGVGTAIAIAISILTWVFAPQIAVLFAYTPESAHLLPEITAFLRTMCFFYPFVPMGMMSSGLFQGTGRGITSFILSLLRNVIFIAFFASLLALTFGLGESGAWWGIVLGDIAGGLVAFGWAAWYVHKLMTKNREKNDSAAAAATPPGA